MSLIEMTVAHGQTFDEARRRLDVSVKEIEARFRSMIRRVEWAEARDRVKVDGVGFWVEMSVDQRDLHATGDIPILGRMLSGPFIEGLRQIVQRTFQKTLPP